MSIVNKAWKKVVHKKDQYVRNAGKVSQLISDKSKLDDIKEWIKDVDENNIWAFSSGHDGEAFRGNPKFLFAYVNNYRKDIRAYWLCNNEDTINQIRSLGFHAYSQKSLEGEYLISRTGVAVAEQIRINMPFGKSTKYLNLWHGNGYKKCERSRIDDTDDLRMELAEKYIKHNAYFMNNMITCCNNPLQEQYFYRDQGISSRQILPAGYPRCTYQSNYTPIKTFEHDLRKTNGLSADARLVVYAPTFREHRGDTFIEAISDLDKLYNVCEKNNILFIFKVHPFMEKEIGFLNAMEKYKDKKHFLFWDNQNDFYEIIHVMDLVIYDYSSMFSDFLLSGVRKYIRYLFDSDSDYCANIMDEESYFKNTCGTICKKFDDLLELIDSNIEPENPEVVEEILHNQWEYASTDDCEKIVDFTLDFTIGNEEFPVLYSFDVFDTLISRKGFLPVSVFYDVKRKMKESNAFDNDYLIDHYPHIRESAAFSVREYMRKSKEERNSFHVEITLEQIINHLKRTFELSDEQCELLTKFEIESEIDSVVPLTENINKVKELINKGETVILVSDMYLPLEVIKEMLRKADPVLCELPMFLSNEYGVQKVSGLLFFEVYRSFKPFYNFSKWIHTGDNINADQKAPRKLGIRTRMVPLREFSNLETSFCEYGDTYDSYQLANFMNKLCKEYNFDKGRFVADYIGPLLVSYVDYVVRDAKNKNFQTLYFVSRDGYFLKKIADVVIKENGFDIKTKYIYASRRTWRLASYIDGIDDGFFNAVGGNFSDIKNKEKFIRAAQFDSEEEFKKVLPHINLDDIDFNDWQEDALLQPGRLLGQSLKNNQKYIEYLLEIGKKKRDLASRYLLQEIDKDEKFAFVEFWGRGYNQTSHSKIWNYAIGKEDITYYYYCRSLCGSEGNCVRYNMTSLGNSLFFMESVFANMPYKSIDRYEEVNGRVEPVIEPVTYDEDLYNTMETLIPRFTKEYVNLGLQDYMLTDKAIFDFLLVYYQTNDNEPFIYENFGDLVDAIGIYGEKRRFARPYTHKDIEDMRNGVNRNFNTSSTTISYCRSDDKVKEEFEELFQLQEGDSPKVNIRLKPEQVEKNRNFKKKCDNIIRKSNTFRDAYEKARRQNKVNDVVVLLTEKTSLDETLSFVKIKLGSLNKYSVEEICSSDLSDLAAVATKLSKAKVVIVNCEISFLSNVELRNETKLVMLTDPSIRVWKQGHNAINFLIWEKKFKELTHDIKFNIFDASSKYVSDQILTSYDANPYSVDRVSGSVATDLYFDKEFISSSKNIVMSKYPQLNGKKLIVYLPDLKPRGGTCLENELLNINKLKKSLGEDYFVLVVVQNRRDSLILYKSVFEIDGFSKIADSQISIRSLLLCADYIVGNFVDQLFESAVLNKPTYFYANDFETRLVDNNIKSQLFDDMPFPIAKNVEDLAMLIKTSNNYPCAPMRAFVDKYLSDCDGNSLNRLTEYFD